MLLMYACGFRVSEAATLEVTAIDGVNGWSASSAKATKSAEYQFHNQSSPSCDASGRPIATSAGCARALAGMGRLVRYALWLTFKQAARQAGITQTRLARIPCGIAMRRDCSKAASTSGLCRFLLGMRPSATTAIYSHLTEPTRTSLKAILDKLMNRASDARYQS